ncbi:hypothetical protein ACFXPT_35440 [Streptomyces goshikiensis]
MPSDGADNDRPTKKNSGKQAAKSAGAQLRGTVTSVVLLKGG